MWVASADLPRGGGHPFYERLNRVLDEAGFDAFVERACAKFYADGVGRPSLAPGPLLPAAAARLLRGPGLGTGDRVAGRRFVEPAAVPGHRAARGVAGPFDGIAHAAADRPGDAPGGLHVGARAAGRRRPGPRQDGGHRCDDAGSQRSVAEHRPPGHGRGLRDVPARAGRGVRHPRRRRARSWPASTASARRRGPTTIGRIRRTRTRRSPA